MHAVTTIVDRVFVFCVTVTADFCVRVANTVDTYYLNPKSLHEGHIEMQGEGTQLHATEDEKIVETVTEENTDEVPTFQSVREILKEHTATVHAHSQIVYTCVPSTPVFTSATVGFDAVHTYIPYGELVVVLGAQGRFYNVAWKEYTGWILKETVRQHAGDVYPHFSSEEVYGPDHPGTVALRMMLNDPFGLQYGGYPLQAGEYIVYRLQKRGVSIPWGQSTERIPGTWHTLLRGNEGVHISVFPKPGTIMEYTGTHDIGYLAYVESVTREDAITCTEVNHEGTGDYKETTYTQDEWRELRPVFIQIRTL